MRTGKIIQVSGSVVDVRFPHGELCLLYTSPSPRDS